MIEKSKQQNNYEIVTFIIHKSKEENQRNDQNIFSKIVRKIKTVFSMNWKKFIKVEKFLYRKSSLVNKIFFNKNIYDYNIEKLYIRSIFSKSGLFIEHSLDDIGGNKKNG